jgi:hypothetical protein
MLILACYYSQWIDDLGVEEISGDASLEVPLPRLVRFRVAGVVAEDKVAVTPSVATATMAPFSTDLDDLFISVKTTRHYHHFRLPAIISTWFQFAKEQVSSALPLPLSSAFFISLYSTVT